MLSVAGLIGIALRLCELRRQRRRVGIICSKVVDGGGLSHFVATTRRPIASLLLLQLGLETILRAVRLVGDYDDIAAVG